MDLEPGAPRAVLPERSAASLSHWLTAHPSVEVIGRDRAGVDAEGARAGAPDALQVADRWHRLKNCSELLLRVLQLHQPAIEQALISARVHVAETPAERPEGATDSPPVAELPPKTSTSLPAVSRAEQLRQQRQAARQGRYDTIQQLHHQGWTQRAIATQLDLAPKTVRTYLRASSCPVPQRRPPRRKLLRHTHHIC